MSEHNQNGNDEGGLKPQRHRSPNHPAINLEEAVAKAASLHEKYGRHHVALGHASELWGYKPNSSVAQQCVAAVKAFGLVEVAGSGKSRKIAVSESGVRIVRNAPDRGDLIAKAAMTPTIHKELVGEFKEKGLPPDDILRQYLVWEREAGKFNEESVDGFIARFRETLGYAGLATNSRIGTGDNEENGGDSDPPAAPNVGDHVQWTSQGVDQFEQPRRLAGVSECGEWAFVEGSQTGIPMSELTVAEPPALPAQEGVRTPPPNPLFKPPAEVDDTPPESAKDRITLDEGPIVLQRPTDLKADSVRDLEDWFAVVIKRLKRRAGIGD